MLLLVSDVFLLEMEVVIYVMQGQHSTCMFLKIFEWWGGSWEIELL